MAENKSPWGSGGNSGGGGGRKPGGPFGGNNRPPKRGEKAPDLENVIQGFKDRFGGGSGGGGGRKGGNPNSKLTKFGPAGFVIMAGLFAMAISSVYIVSPMENAVVLRFGEYQRTVTDGGLKFKFPTPFETVIKKDVTTEQSFAQKNVLVLTKDENIVDVQFTVFYRIRSPRDEGVIANDVEVNTEAESAAVKPTRVSAAMRPGIEDYVFKVEEPETIVRFAADSALREIIGKTDLDVIIGLGRKDIDKDVRELMQRMLDDYQSGLKVTTFQLQEADVPRSVLSSRDKVVNAEQTQEKLVNEGLLYRNKVTEEAIGRAAVIVEDAEAYKQKVVAVANGEADRFKAVYREYKLAPEVTRQRIYLETMEEVYKDADKIIMDGNAGSGVVPYLPLDQLNRNRSGGQ